MDCPFCDKKLIEGKLICPHCRSPVMDFNYIENFNKMKEKYSKNILLDLSKEKLTFEEVVTIHTFIERDSHHSGDFDVSDKCRSNGTSSNLSKRLKELRNE